MFEGSVAEAGYGVGSDSLGRVVGWRWASAEDVREFFGAIPGETLRATVITLDGRVAGIIGIARAYAFTRLFSEYKPELDPYLGAVAVWRAVKAVMRVVESQPQSVYSFSQHDDGARILARLGFEQVSEGVFVWRS